MTFEQYCIFMHDKLNFKIDIFRIPDNAEPAPHQILVYKFRHYDPKKQNSYYFTIDPLDPDWKRLATMELRHFKIWRKADDDKLYKSDFTLRGAILQQLLCDYAEVKKADNSRKWRLDAEDCVEQNYLSRLYDEEWPALKDAILKFKEDREALKEILLATPYIQASMTRLGNR